VKTETLLLVTVIAVTVEALVEYGKTVVKTWKTEKATVALQLTAVVVSVCLCLLIGADVYGALGVRFHAAPVGCILTGIFAARGANFLSDFVGRLRDLLHTS
jgi:hypothetical protein